MENFDINNQDYSNGVILAVSSSYDRLYYFNDDFDNLPEAVQKELQILMVMHTEELGGQLIIGFRPDGELFIESKVKEFDAYYDEIGTHLKIKSYMIEKKELFESLQEYYNCFF